jgi:hypothetical protein
MKKSHNYLKSPGTTVKLSKLIFRYFFVTKSKGRCVYYSGWQKKLDSGMKFAKCNFDRCQM